MFAIEFLVSGEITWVTPSGRTEKKQRVESGQRITVELCEKDKTTGDFYIVSDGWNCLLPASSFSCEQI
jgi:hypothetical protein